MKVIIRHLLKKVRGSGGYAQRDEIVDASTIRFGRGADCEVHLPDPRVLLHHAELTHRSGGLYLEATGQVEIQLNGAIVHSARVKPGDKAQIGPYDLEFVEPEGDSEATLTLELVRPLGDDLSALTARSKVHLTRAGLGMRGWAWLLFLVVAVAAVGAPLAAFFTKAPIEKTTLMGPDERPVLARADKVWKPGPFSGVHSFFGEKCEACHVEPFEQVQSAACLGCHEDTGHHADPIAFPAASLSQRECQTCHKEHTGSDGLVIQGERFCVSCHGNFDEIAGDSRLKTVSGFETHPQFHPTVRTQTDPPVFERLAVDATPPPIDGSNIKFPHKTHLNPEGLRNPMQSERMALTCSDCHQPETGGVAMLPVSFEDECASCHRLQFEQMAPDRAIPHGNIADAKRFVYDSYAALALRGGLESAKEDLPAVIKRIPGTPLPEEDRLEALAWAEQKAEETLGGRFGRGLCGQCHTISEGDGALDWGIEPVHLTKRWLPKGYFDHRAHLDVDCSTCHAAPESETAEDVLLPDIAVCQGCHGGEDAVGKIQSGCTDCHGFHQDRFGPAVAPAHDAAMATD